MSKFLRYVVSIVVLALAAGCATVDLDYPKTASSVITDTDDSFLAKAVADEVAANPGKGGFFPIYDGKEALAVRLLLAERAEYTIDAQYFLIYDDVAGNAFANVLLRAANRGVRVRFLLDDILSKGLDPGLSALNSHPNIEVRIFNPLGHRSARALNVFNYDVMTRRMHNKSFTVDNKVTIIGGRNIAGEYFDARPDEEFHDLDVLGIGPIVDDVSNMFDIYWNFRASLPITALADVPEDADARLAGLQDKVDNLLAQPESAGYGEAVKNSGKNFVAYDEDKIVWADYDFVHDSPDKSSKDTVGDAELIVDQMKDVLGQPQESLFISTPYFVLLDDQVASFGAARDRGVDITVLTNSLASNNHTSVHSAYYPTRKPLLNMGVNLYELRAIRSRPIDEKPQKTDMMSTLHAKAFVVDNKSFFIGSFNWNQRSVNRDSESGVIIHSPLLAQDFVQRVSAILPTSFFELSLDDSNDVVWTIQENGQDAVMTKDPQTSGWKRFSAWFLRIAPASEM